MNHKKQSNNEFSILAKAATKIGIGGLKQIPGMGFGVESVKTLSEALIEIRRNRSDLFLKQVVEKHEPDNVKRYLSKDRNFYTDFMFLWEAAVKEEDERKIEIYANYVVNRISHDPLYMAESGRFVLIDLVKNMTFSEVVALTYLWPWWEKTDDLLFLRYRIPKKPTYGDFTPIQESYVLYDLDKKRENGHKYIAIPIYLNALLFLASHFKAKLNNVVDPELHPESPQIEHLIQVLYSLERKQLAKKITSGKHTPSNTDIFFLQCSMLVGGNDVKWGLKNQFSGSGKTPSTFLPWLTPTKLGRALLRFTSNPQDKAPENMWYFNFPKYLKWPRILASEITCFLENYIKSKDIIDLLGLKWYELSERYSGYRH